MRKNGRNPTKTTFENVVQHYEQYLAGRKYEKVTYNCKTKRILEDD